MEGRDLVHKGRRVVVVLLGVLLAAVVAQARLVAIVVLQIAVVLAVLDLRVLFFLTPRGMKFIMPVEVDLVHEIKLLAIIVAMADLVEVVQAAATLQRRLVPMV